jgi:acetyltransferase-like isoleucine patch superfamily enzyme
VSTREDVRIADTAIVHPDVVLAPGCQVWHHSQVREGVRMGRGCILGKDVYVDADVTLGDYCKVQNGAQLFHGAVLEDGVFVGPGVILTNDRVPRAINPDGSLKDASDWIVGRTVIRRGASIGAGATIVTGVTIGRFAMIGAGAVVTGDVPDHALLVGVPARPVGWVCACGARLAMDTGRARWHCEACQRRYERPDDTLREIKETDSGTTARDAESGTTIELGEG